MNLIEKIFKTKKPVIGMLHLDWLEGENFKGIDHVVGQATKDIESLQDGGINGILIENWKENSIGEFVSDETAKNFREVVDKVKDQIKIPFGINVLNNDYKLAFLTAKESGASFVELDVFSDKVQSDFQNNEEAIKNPFVIDPKPKEIWDYAKSTGVEHIPLFVFVQPKHYIMLDKEKTIEESTKEAVENGASAVLVTKATGFAPTIGLIERVKKAAGDTPVGIGSGFSTENANEFMKVVDFAVVGTSIKVGDETDSPVDIKRVQELMDKMNNSKT
jgi:uncharacterized protein